MSEETWIKDRLRSGVPTPPTSPDRFAEVTLRHRRHTRRRAVGVVVGTIALVAVIALPAGLLVSQHFNKAGVLPADGPSVGPGKVAACPSKPIDVTDLSGSAQLPTGVTWVRVCSGLNGGPEVPDEVIKNNLDPIVSAINSAMATPAGGDGQSCPADIDSPFQLLVGYPDGSSRQVVGENFGCGSLYVGDGTGAGAQQVWSTVQRALSIQRVLTPGTECPDNAYVDTTADPATMTRAVACWAWGGVGDVSRVTTPQLTTLVSDWTTQTATKSAVNCPDTAASMSLYGLTADDELVRIDYYCDGWLPEGTQITSGDDLPKRVVRPGAAAKRAVNQIIGRNQGG